jgi:hypothetical protein
MGSKWVTLSFLYPGGTEVHFDGMNAYSRHRSSFFCPQVLTQYTVQRLSHCLIHQHGVLHNIKSYKEIHFISKEATRPWNPLILKLLTWWSTRMTIKDRQRANLDMILWNGDFFPTVLCTEKFPNQWHTYTHACVHTCKHTCTHTCTHAHTHAHTHMHVCTHAHTHTRTHTHAHTHTHMEMGPETEQWQLEWPCLPAHFVFQCENFHWRESKNIFKIYAISDLWSLWSHCTTKAAYKERSHQSGSLTLMMTRKM